MNNRNGVWGHVLMVCLLMWTPENGIPGVGGSSPTAEESALSLSQRVKEAELIFYGVVTKLEYELSGAGPGPEKPLPHTYVTYRFEETLKGRSAEGKSVTLRFLGGVTPDGRYLEASHMPQFQVGDEDLLFVQKNTQIDCPLVACGNGRFRVIKKGVYADDRRAVVDIRKGHFLYDNRAISSSAPLTIERVKVAIREEVKRAYTAQDLKTLKPVRSAQPGSHESIPPHSDQTAPETADLPPPVPQPMSDEDRSESEAIQRNLGNPVLDEDPSR